MKILAKKISIDLLSFCIQITALHILFPVLAFGQEPLAVEFDYESGVVSNENWVGGYRSTEV